MFFSTLFDGRGELALTGCVVTAYGGYGKETFLDALNSVGVSSVLVIPDSMKRAHPFVAAWYIRALLAEHD